MSTRRDNDAPVTGGRAPSSTEAPGSQVEPGSRSEPGSGGPVLSTGPEPSSAAGPGSGARARPPAPAPTGPALRVVLVSRDSMLAGAIRYADVVVVDMPPNLHQRTFAVIDGRFLGRTVVLLQEGEHPEAVPTGPARAILYRPLQIGELWGAVTGALPSAAAPPLPDDARVAEAEEPEVEVPEEDELSPGIGIEVPGPTQRTPASRTPILPTPAPGLRRPSIRRR